MARSPLGLFGALAVTFIGQFGAWPTLGGISTELFPTAYRALARSAARSAAGAAAITGQVGSFLAASVLIGLTGSFSRSSSVLVAGPALALVIVVFCFPETAGRELE